MKIQKKQLNPHQVELTVHVSRSEALPHLTAAAAHLSTHNPIKGFRPGKASYEVAKKHFGEEAIFQEAHEDIINTTFNQALAQEQLSTYGKIDFDLLPALDPETITSYKATVTLAPTVKLGDWKTKKIKRQEVKISDDELNKALDELTAMITKEEPTDKPAATGDKVVVDFEVEVDGKIIDGGKAEDFGMIIGEGRMIPGFEEQLVGHKAPEEIKFTLNFPADYHAKELAGKPANFKINLKQVLARIKPSIDDALATRVGVKDLTELKTVLTENIKKEKLEHEEERVEIAGIKQVVESSTFTEIPPAMIEDTITDLVADFEHTLAHRGMKMTGYLMSIKKTPEQLREDFKPKAIERIRSSIALGQLAEDEKIGITSEEIDAEIALLKKAHAGHDHNGHKHSPDEYNTPEYRRHVATSLINRKIIGFIRDQIIE